MVASARKKIDAEEKEEKEEREREREQPQPQAQPTVPLAELGERNASEIATPPPRAWLLGSVFCRTFISSLIAEGGVGKTALRYAQLIALAIGRSLTGEHVWQRCRVIIVSLEDSDDELDRRICAVLKALRHRQVRDGRLALDLRAGRAGRQAYDA